MAKAKLRQNKDREERITMEIIVDAYGPEEQAMGWYYIGLSAATKQYVINGKKIYSRTMNPNNSHFGRRCKDNQLLSRAKVIFSEPKHKYILPLSSEIREKLQSIKCLYPKRAESKDAVAPEDHSGEGGSIPTSALHTS